MRVEWAEGTRLSVPAEDVHKTVDRIRRRNGGVCPPQALVDAGRPDDSPVHGLFEWDDEYAAEQYRTQQARQAIKSLRIVYDDTDDDTPSYTPAYVSVVVMDDEGVRSGYMPSGEVRRNPELYQQVLNSVKSQLHGLRRRHQSLKELTPVWDALDEVEEGEQPKRRHSTRSR